MNDSSSIIEFEFQLCDEFHEAVSEIGVRSGLVYSGVSFTKTSMTLSLYVKKGIMEEGIIRRHLDEIVADADKEGGMLRQVVAMYLELKKKLTTVTCNVYVCKVQQFVEL